MNNLFIKLWFWQKLEGVSFKNMPAKGMKIIFSLIDLYNI